MLPDSWDSVSYVANFQRCADNNNHAQKCTKMHKIRQLLLKHFMEFRWYSIVLAMLSYVVISWILLWLCNEKALVSADDYLYWLMITASTVGYGDLSPVTTAGKYVVALFITPVGLGLFGIGIGRVAAFAAHQWRRGVKGLKAIDSNNHLLVIGWNGQRTIELLKLLHQETCELKKAGPIVLCVKADMENPMPDIIDFVRVKHFSNDEDMLRAGIQNAATIVIDNDEDDVTMTTALYCASRNPEAHTIAYFHDEKLGKLLKEHCPNIECMPSVSVEMLAKSAVDPGSSALHHQLLNSQEGMTQFSVTFSGKNPIPVQAVFTGMKRHYNATLIGLAKQAGAAIEINPDLDRHIAPGSTLYYIAKQRIQQIDWQAVSQSVAEN